jgi:hypothetical protein
MKKTKIVIIIPVYKRPEVTAICFKWLHYFITEVKTWDVRPLIILSPEDKYLENNKDECECYGFKYVYFHNQPVGNKLNAGINYALQKYKFDYIMNMGSDNIIHPSVELLYRSHINKTCLFFGINNLFIYELKTKKTFWFHKYNDIRSIGAGRMIHISIIEAFNYKKYPVYDTNIDREMDTNSAKNIEKILGIKDEVIDVGQFPYVVDIKTDTNINHIMFLEGLKEQIQYFGDDYLKQYFNVLT